MLIVCPNCKKRFDIDPGPGQEARKLRCSNCRAVFKVVRKAAAVNDAPTQSSPPEGAGAASRRASAPLSAPAAPSWHRDEPSAPASPLLPGEGQGGDGGGGPLKIVIANESAPFCEAVKKVLAAEPFDVTVCNDGKVALETVERMRPALILLDVALPTVFGFEVCERIRQNPALSGVKIVLIASIYDKTRYKRSPKSLYGADDYIEKHHIPDSLVPMIYRLTSGAAPAQQLVEDGELASHEETRAEIRQAEVHDTVAATEPASQFLATEAQPPLETVSFDGNRYDDWRQEPAEAFPIGADSPGAAAESVALQEILPAEEIAPFEEAVAPPAPELGEAEVKARRLARIIVSDIVLYNQAKVEQGVREDTFYELLAEDIKEGERLYRQRVPEHVREATTFLQDAFQDLVNKKRAELRA